MSRRIATLAILLLVTSGAGCRPGGEAPVDPRTVPDAEQTTVASPDAPAEVRDARVPVAPRASDAPMRLVDVATDNYKASFNDDPTVPELRTWLAIRELELDGGRWTVSSGEFVPDEARFEPEPLPLEPVDDVARRQQEGGAAPTVDWHVEGGPVDSVQWRLGPQPGRWGPLLKLSDRAALERDPVRLRLIVEGAGSQFELPLEYRHDEGIAAAPEESLEHNGPGGRWYVDGEVTRTNLEAGWR